MESNSSFSHDLKYQDLLTGAHSQGDDVDYLMDEDEEISKLEQQIDDVESAIRSITLSTEEKSQFHEQELNELQVKLDETKEQSKIFISNQETQQNKEVDELIKSYEHQISLTQSSIKSISANSDLWKQSKGDLEHAKRQAMLIDAEHKLLNEKTKAIQQCQLQLHQNEQSRLEKDFIVSQLETEIDHLETEINDLQIQQRQINLDLQQQSNQLMCEQESRQNKHEESITQFKQQINARQKQNDAHLESMRERLSNEQDLIVKEKELAKNQIDQLNEVYHNLSSHGARQLTAISKEIEELKETLDKVRESTANYKSKPIITQMNFQDNIEDLEERLKIVNQQNEAAMRELGIPFSSNSPMVSKSAPKSPRTGQFRSWF